jgi:hypothetical protein
MTLTTITRSMLGLALAASLALVSHHGTAQAHQANDTCVRAFTTGYTIPGADGAWTNLQFTCDTTGVFAHTVDPYWFSSAMACVDDSWAPTPGTVETTRVCSAFAWFPFGGSVDSPVLECLKGHWYQAYGKQESHWVESPAFTCDPHLLNG